jgi:hypothetical protein
MKIFGIHILKDDTLQILLKASYNTALNETAYQNILGESPVLHAPLAKQQRKIALFTFHAGSGSHTLPPFFIRKFRYSPKIFF